MAGNTDHTVQGIKKKARQILSYCGQLLLAAVLLTIYFFADRKTIKFTTSEKRREYLLHVPPDYSPSKPTPLVITIHGFAEWPAHVMRISGWNKLADQAGFLVVYPSGTGFPKHWRILNRQNTLDGAAIEVSFIAELIDHLEKTYNIDPNHIYANGFSNGGGMTHVLTEELPQRIAAAGVVSGALIYPFQIDPGRRRVPLIAFHGTDDPIVPYAGGPSRYFAVPFPSIPEWMQQWARKNECDPNPVQILCSEHVSGIQYVDSDRRKDTILYTIEGGGHTWPGGLAIQKFMVGKTSSEINATELMWQFFEQHPLQG